MNKRELKQTLLDSLYVVAFVALIFMLTVATIMLIQQRSISSVSPLDFAEIEQLKQQARSPQSSEELHLQIRKLDLLSRQGWFLGLDWLQTGGRMLAAAAFVFIFCIFAISQLSDKQADINKPKLRQQPTTEVKSLVAVAVVSVIAANLLYLNFWPLSASETNDKKPAPAVAEVVEVTTEEFMQNWPLFRGPDNLGIAPAHQLVSGWGDDLDTAVKWKLSPPMPGYSSPIVWQNKVFITGGDEVTRNVYAYNAETGDLLWEHEASGIQGSPPVAPGTTDDTGYAAATPATDGNRIFSIFATGDLVCTDLDGNRLWARNMGVPDNMYGYSSSLLTANDKLVVQFDNDDRQILFCLNPASGETIWKAERDSIVSWSSPALARLDDGRNLVVILTCMEVEAYNLATGGQEWIHPIMGGEVAPSMTFSNGIVYVANENACAAAINASTGELLWQNYSAIFPDVSSPVVYKDILFLFTSAATISAIAATTGETLWEEDVNEGFYSSPLLVNDRIAAFDMNGDMLVVKPDREKLIIESTDSLGDKVLTTPALKNDMMWVRAERYLYCIQKPR